MAVPVEMIDGDLNGHPEIIRALLLDDSAFDRARIRRMSRDTDLMLSLKEVGSITSFRDAIASEVFDLILIDYRLPQGDGLDVLQLVQQCALNQNAATLMVTGNGEVETAVTAMRRGCHDYLSKDGMTAVQLRSAMLCAINSAVQQRKSVTQADPSDAAIRHGIAAALGDEAVQGRMAALLRSELERVLPRLGGPANLADHQGFDDLLIMLDANDEFVFE